MRKKTKFFLLRSVIILLFGVLAGRIWYVQVVMGSYYRQQADTSKIRLLPVLAMRGIIYDRNGHQLVYNSPSWNVTVVPHGVPRAEGPSIYARLSHLLGNSPPARRIASLVAASSWRPYAPALIKANVSQQTAMVIKQLHSQLPGVRADPVSVRNYPEDPQNSLAHILGYAGAITADELSAAAKSYPAEHYGANDQVGRSGLELKLDPYLHGVNGTAEVEVDAGERPIRALQPGKAVAGDSVYLTIDANLQQQVASDLQAALAQLHARRGVAIVEDVHTGAIRAMVSLPSFDNNWFAPQISTKRYSALLTDPSQPLMDLATQGQFPPGSTFKIVTAVAALQTGVADANRYITDTGSIKLCSVYDPTSCRVFNGWNQAGLGSVNVVGALARSSDIYFYTVAGGNPNDGAMPYVGGDRLAYWARQLGLGAQTGIELPGEQAGLIPSPQWFNSLKPGPLRNPGETWHIGNTYNMAIGQGQDDATPLQMVDIAATVANGGTLYRPHLVDRIVGRLAPRRGILRRPQVIQPFVPTIVRTGFIDPANLSLIQAGMHQGVSSDWNTGTSVLAYDPRIDAAGKTGTAEDLPRPPHAWWVGYAPFTNPKVAVVVMVPNANGEGAYAAAPIAHKVFEDYFHLKPLKRNWVSDVSAQLVGNGGGAQ